MTHDAIQAGTDAQIFELLPLPQEATQGDLLRYIERTRRQLDRFEELPEGSTRQIDTDAAARIRTMCDKLENEILQGLATA